MKYNQFNEAKSLVDDDILLIQESNTLAIKKVKLSTLKQYIGVASGDNANSIKDEILKDNPIGYWQLDEITGASAINLGSGMSNGTYNAVTLAEPSLATGSNYAAAFNIATSKVSFTNTILNNNTDISIECIVTLSSLSLQGGFFEIGDNSGIGFGVGNGTYSSPGNEFIGIAGNVAWKPSGKLIGIGTHHLVLVYKGATTKEWWFYIDGFLVQTLGYTLINVPNTTGYFKGVDKPIVFDELAIYNKALTPRQCFNHAAAVIY